MVWAGWHVVPYPAQGHDVGWIVLQCAITVVTRVLMGLLFRLTDETSFPAIGFHALLNATPGVVARGGYAAFDLRVYAVLVLVATVVIGLVSLRPGVRQQRVR